MVQRSSCRVPIVGGDYIKQELHSLETVDDNIAGFPGEIQTIFEQIRSIIRETVLDAEEVIGY